MGVRDELAGRSVGEFLLRERIGEGGFGAVYRCEQPLLGREAVIKVLHRRLRDNEVVAQRFLREARLASRLDHPYAAHVYAFGVEKDDGLLWIAMEMVHGTTLDRWLAERGPLPLAALVPFFERIAEVVQTAHERGIIHRDLKPSNVMVIERAGQLLPKLLDLGIAKLLGDDPPERPPAARPVADAMATADTGVPVDGTLSVSHDNVRGVAAVAQLTNAGAALGSPPYMAPEMWTDGEIGPAVDIYALGVLAYEALLGHRPFVARTLAGYIDLHTSANVPSVGDELPHALDPWFARALAKRAADRPATALELAAGLRVAAGLADAPGDLPRLERGVHDAWIADAPQPLAEAVAAVEGARNAHQARDAARDLLAGVLRYITMLALAAHAQVRESREAPAIGELVRALRRRELDEDERLRLLRRLVEPFRARRGAHPLPALVDLLLREDPDDDPLALALAIESTSDGRTDDHLQARLVRLVAALARLLRAAAFVLDHPVVVVRDGAPERWSGLRRRRRPAVVVRGRMLEELQPALIDGDGNVVLLLWPLVQALAPTPGADPELFVFDGRGRTGARLVAAPFERHDPAVWDWLAEHVLETAGGDAAAADVQVAPYLGLAAFTAADAERFVGREREVDTFVNRLRVGALQVVVGASGAGKSSFVQAGVVPALPPGWRVAVMRPGGAPVAALAARLAQIVPGIALDAPATAATSIGAQLGDGTLVLVIDQLEELVTLCRDAGERERFAAVVGELAASERPIRVVCTLRDDFLMRIEALPHLGPRLATAVFLLGNPSHDDLVRTIVEPARRAGYELADAELAADMARAVAGRPGALALLSFTASRLWELRDRRFRQLTRKAYDAMGGVGGALGRHAEDTLATLGADDQRLVREAFRRLVTADGTRARVAVAELAQVLASERATAVVDKLVAARLLVAIDGDGGTEIEVAHEALLVAWPRIQQWIREDAEGARMRDQLGAAARQWEASGRSRGLLWRDDVLLALERWRSEPRALTVLEAAFADASAADAARGRRIRRGLIIAAFAVLAVGMIVTLTLRSRADDARALAESARQRARDQLAESYEEQGRRLLLEGDTNAALVYFDEAMRIGADSPALRFMVARALEPLATEVATLAVGARVRRARFAPGHPRGPGAIATASSDGTVRVWDLDGRERARLELARGEVDAAWSPDGTTLAAIDTRGHLALWNPTTGDHRRIPLPASAQLTFPVVQFAGDGARLAVTEEGDAFGSVVVELATGRVARLAPQVSNLEFSHAGDRVAGGTRDGHAYVWTTAGTRVADLVGHRAGIWSVAFSPDDTRVVTASLDDTARVFDSRTGAALATLPHEQRVTHATFLRGDLVATASADRTVKVWNAATGSLAHTLRGHTGQLNRIAFAGDAALISVANDGMARLWDVRGGIETAAFVHAGSVFELDVSREGRFLATASWVGTARVFSLARTRRVATWSSPAPLADRWPVVEAGGTILRASQHGWFAIPLAGPATELAKLAPGGAPVRQSSGALAATGAIAALALPDGGIALVEVADPQLRRTFPAHASQASGIAVSPDGRWVASCADGELVIADAGTGVVVRHGVLASGLDQLAFTPDGRRLLAYGTGPARPRLLDPTTLAEAASFGAPTTDVDAVAVSPDSRYVAVAADRLTVWTVDGILVATLPDPEQAFAIAWTRDSSRVAVGLNDGSIVVWSFADGGHRRFQAHGGWIESLAYEPGARLLASSSGDGSVAIWDPETARRLWTVASSEISQVKFDATGDRLIVSGAEHVNAWRSERATATLAELAELVRCRARKRIRDGRIEDADDACR